MGIIKHGDKSDGRVIPEDDDQTKTAAQNWTEKDQAELLEECADDD